MAWLPQPRMESSHDRPMQMQSLHLRTFVQVHGRRPDVQLRPGVRVRDELQVRPGLSLRKLRQSSEALVGLGERFAARAGFITPGFRITGPD